MANYADALLKWKGSGGMKIKMAVSKGALCTAVVVASVCSLMGATSAFADDYRHVAEAQTMAESRLDAGEETERHASFSDEPSSAERLDGVQDMPGQAKVSLASASVDGSGDSEDDDGYGSQGLSSDQMAYLQDLISQYNKFLEDSGSNAGESWFGNRFSLSGSMVGDNAGGGMFMTGILIGVLIGAGGMFFAIRSFGKKKDCASSGSAEARR